MSSVFHVVLLLQLLLPIIAAGAETVDRVDTISPNCPPSCGSVSIPYPFGIGDGCYREGFDITCNTSFSPPKPFIGNTMAELIDIKLSKGQARVYKHIDWACFNQTEVVESGIEALNLANRSAFKISDTNKFTAIGCYIAGIVGDTLPTGGCITVCTPANVSGGTCTGIGCCQTAIPEGHAGMETDFLPLGYTGGDWQPKGPIRCGYAFIAEENWYNFSPADLDNYNKTHKEGVPVVIDWSIDNKTCEEAQLNSTSYACKGINSKCFKSTSGAGYICNCSAGYQGNPYLPLPDGCQDINECEHPLEYSCYYKYCTNTPGNYTCSCPPGTDGDPTRENGCTKSKTSLPRYATPLIASASVLFVVTFLSFWIYLGIQKTKLMRAKRKFFEQNGGLMLQQQLNSHQGRTAFKLFGKEEIEKATNNFDTSMIIGQGGHGIVYKGILTDNRVVAIKKSRIMDADQMKEFAKEMLILSQINHKSVIKLLGCCLEVEVPMLVYEFVSQGNLYQYIHNHKYLIPLVTRLRIAAESADALAYLHSSASPPIIHGDVKSANILLDEEYVAKVSDFGASKMAPKDQQDLATLVQGTCGYLDPEYLLTCQLTEKSDVYSFGVVILELLTRRKVLDFAASGDNKNLVSCFLSAMKEDKLAEILDTGLENEDLTILKEVAKIVLLCLKVTGDERPTMKEVVAGLERLLKLKQQQILKQSNYAEGSNNMSGMMFSDIPAQSNDNMSISNITESVYQHGSGSYSLEVQHLPNIESGR